MKKKWDWLKDVLISNRRWIGMTMCLAGSGMVLVHWIDYGLTGHLIFPDHGVGGLALFILGWFIGVGRPGQNYR